MILQKAGIRILVLIPGFRDSGTEQTKTYLLVD